MAVTPSLSELKKILKSMTWKDRVEYLWTYYKIVLVAILGVVMFISIVVSSIQNKQIKTLYSGMTVGIQMSQEDRENTTQELTALFEGDGKKQVVELADVSYIPGDDPANLETNNAAAMKITLMVAAESLDYLLVDGDVYDELIRYNTYQDLRNVLTQTQQEQLEEYIIWKEAYEEIPSYPMALDISHTSFVKTLAPYEKEVYLVFVGNTENGSRDQAFINYILNWKE